MELFGKKSIILFYMLQLYYAKFTTRTRNTR